MGQMKVVVLGAGVIGVTSAWYLAQAGHEVTVVDRHVARVYQPFGRGYHIHPPSFIGLSYHATYWATFPSPL